MSDSPKPMLIEGTDIYIMTTGNPVEDLKWIYTDEERLKIYLLHRL